MSDGQKKRNSARRRGR